jgi:hypothetical protein
VLLGGCSNIICCGATGSAIIGGCAITATAPFTTYSNNFCATNKYYGDASALTGRSVIGIISSSNGNCIYNPNSNLYNFIGAGASNYISGNVINAAPVLCSFIGAGCNNKIISNDITSTYNFLAAGETNSICDSSNSSVINGYCNSLYTALYATIVGGYCNCVIGLSCDSAILAGKCNIIDSSDDSAVLAGDANWIYCSNTNSAILAGADNMIISYNDGSIIVGGSHHCINNCVHNSAILAGYNNAISSNSVDSSIIAGNDNIINSSWYSVIAGNSSCICCSTGIYILGSNICPSGIKNTVFVNNICTSGGQYYGNGGGLISCVFDCTGSSVLACCHQNSIIKWNSNVTGAICIPSGLDYNIGSYTKIIQAGCGAVTVSGLAGNTMLSLASKRKTNGAGAAVTVTKLANNCWFIEGDLI